MKRLIDVQAEIPTLFHRLAAKSDRQGGGRWLPLSIHLLDTAGIMRKLIEEWLPESLRRAVGLSESELLSAAVYVALVHDIGKASIAFESIVTQSDRNLREYVQAMTGIRIPQADTIDQTARRETRHTICGAAILKEQLECPDWVVQIVGAHHGETLESCQWIVMEFYFEDRGDAVYGKKDRRLFQSAWDEWNRFAMEYSGFSSVNAFLQLSVPGQFLLTGILIMADWLASNTLLFPLITLEETRAFSFTGEEERVDAAWKKVDFPSGWKPSVSRMTGELFESRFHFPPNGMQRMTTEAFSTNPSAGLWILESPMGSGKTEAALALAELLAGERGEGGLFFGLPTQATADAIFERLMAGWTQKEAEESGGVLSVRLAHSTADLNKTVQALEQAENTSSATDEDAPPDLRLHPWFDGRKKALLSDFVVGTVDQLLMAGLKRRHLMLRHLGLAGKVVIVDECHAYDAYMDVYLCSVLSWLGAYGVPVILLSATLPPGLRLILLNAYTGRTISKGAAKTGNAYPVLTVADRDSETLSVVSCPYDRPSKQVLIRHIDEEEMLSVLKKILADGGCSGIIVNTVRRAQELAEKLSGDTDATIILDHARFTAEDRRIKDNAVLRSIGKESDKTERAGTLIIGTQVLEQSLDIDMDVLFTELCPMDLLLQRIGREHRHPHHDKLRPDIAKTPICYILQSKKPEGRYSSVYDSWILRATEAELPKQVSIPDDIPALVRAVYDKEPQTEDDIILWKQFQQKIKKKEASAENFCLPVPEALDSDSILGLLENSSDIGNDNGMGQVRDGVMMPTVILLIKDENGRIRSVPWRENGVELDCARIPERDEIERMMKETLRLPQFLLQKGSRSTEELIGELEDNSRIVSEWMRVPALKDEYFWFLDEDLSCTLCGRKFRYSQEYGLREIDEEQEEG